MPENRFGIYVHWPFCQAKCPYCDFNSHVQRGVDQDQWAQAFESELDRVAQITSDKTVRSVFFGGGTPSLMEVKTVDRILSRIQRNWPLANDVEVTLEANPTSVEAAKFAGFRQAGVNRVSVGVQALNDADLRALGRLHSVDEALKAVAIAHKNFSRVSFDLIYARQNQSAKGWEAELHHALSLAPDHLSLYQLTIENGTAFGRLFKKGRLRGLPNEDLGADLWEITQDLCNGANLPAYETSNHAKPGQESAHNLTYWASGDWVGVGPGAHGRLTIGNKRLETASYKSPQKWLSAVAEGSGDEVHTALSDQDILEERLMMGLRLRNGIEMPDLWVANKTYKINALSDLGLLLIKENRIAATESGRPLLNSLIEQLLID